MIGLVAVLALHTVALSDEDRVSFVVLRGDGSEGCPDDDELMARVRERIGSEPFAEEPGLAARQMRLGIERVDARDAQLGLEARIALFSSEGARLGRRVLRGDVDCVELTNDLVLAVAIAIDPLLLVRRRAPPTTLVIVRKRAPPSSASTRPLVQVRARPAEGPSFEVPAPAAVFGRALVSVAAGVGVVAVPQVRVEASLDYGVLDLDAGLRFDLFSRYPVADNALIDLTLIALDAAPCVGVDVELTTLRGCGTVQGGVLVVQAIGFVEPRASTTPWLALGARGAVDLHLWQGLGLVFAGELQAPLIRARFVDDVTRQTLTEPAIVVGSLGVGLELQLR